MERQAGLDEFILLTAGGTGERKRMLVGAGKGRSRRPLNIRSGSRKKGGGRDDPRKGMARLNCNDGGLGTA